MKNGLNQFFNIFIVRKFLQKTMLDLKNYADSDVNLCEFTFLIDWTGVNAEGCPLQIECTQVL